MADFQFYLNRQGVRGAKGVKGDKGDSPIVSVNKHTANEYVLQIDNPDGTQIITPNLVGQQIVVNTAGDYVKYDRNSNQFVTVELPSATGEEEGLIRLATDADYAERDEFSAVTPYGLVQHLPSLITVSADNLIRILYDEPTDSIVLDTSKISEDISSVNANMATKQNKLVQGDNITLIENDDGTTTISAVGGELPDNIAYTDVSNTFNGNQKITAGSLRIGDYRDNGTYISLMLDEICYYKKGVIETRLMFWGSAFETTNNYFDMRIGSDYKLSIEKDVDNDCLKIRTYGLHNVNTSHSFLRDVDVDGQTIQVVNGKLHANFNEINGEISNVSSRVTTLEGQVGDISAVLDSINGEVI